MRNSVYLASAAVLAVYPTAAVSAQEKQGGGDRKTAPVWQCPLAASAWRAEPERVRESERPVRVRLVDSPAGAGAPAEPAIWVRQADTGTTFGLVGRVHARRAMAWSMPLPETLTGGSFPFVSVRYRAQGIARHTQPVAVLQVEGADAEGKPASVTLLDAGEMRNDGQWHRAVAKRGLPHQPKLLRVAISTYDSEAELEVAEISFSERLPTPVPVLSSTVLPADGASGDDLVPIDLGQALNGAWGDAMGRVLDRQGLVTDPGWPSGGELRVGDSGLRFALGAPERNLIVPPENREVNNEPASFAGTATTRHFYCPIGRDDPIAVPVNRSVSEVFLLLVAELAQSHRPYASPLQPPDFTDIGALAVELRYADGRSEEAFPYSLADGGYALQRACGAYAVAADAERELRQVVLHNRLFGTTVSLAAVTVNTSARRLLPQLAAEPEHHTPPHHPDPRPRPPRIEDLGEGRFQLNSRYYSAVFATAQGFAIETLQSRWSDTPIRLDPRSGMELIVGDTVFTGRSLTTESARINGASLTVTLRGTGPIAGLRLTATVTATDSPRLTTRLTAENTGPDEIRATIRFPVLRGVTIGTAADTWVFFPQYRTVVTNERGTWLSYNDLKYVTQIMDAYSPKAGIGVGLMTRNTGNTPVDYGMSKDNDGVGAFVQHPAEYAALKPGATYAPPEADLLFHRGDWHEPLRTYREWVATWHKPVLPPAREWFRRLAVLRTHNMRKFYSWSIPIYDEEAGTYRIDPFIEGDTEYLRMKPEMIHFFGWRDLDTGWRGHPNGDYRDETYTGGKATFVDTVRRIQDHHGIPLSLYTISDRVFRESDIGKARGKSLVRKRADGSEVSDAANYYLCPNVEPWHRHYAQALAKTRSDTGVEALYVDVFGYPRNSACWADDHGHPVPSDPNKGCLDLLRAIRKAVPEDLVIWSEYPVNDLSMPHIDGFIHYYCLQWHEHFSRWYDNLEGVKQTAPVAQTICRYAFPEVKTVVFLCGVSNWASDQKFPFFNGDGLYDVSWFLYASPHLDRMRKSLAIQAEYVDCLATMAPEPLVPTERAHVHANRFPGHGRVLWTLYNARYQTVTGTVMAVPHRDGATYRDVWNDAPLTPRIENGKAYLDLTLPPQGLGCIVQTGPGAG